MRLGDVYTYNLEDKTNLRVKSGKRPFIIIEMDMEIVTAVPLTTRLDSRIDSYRVYSQLTVNGVTRQVCILADMPTKISKKALIKKIAHIEKDLLNEIIEKIKLLV